MKLSAVTRIAKWELTNKATGLDRRTVALALLACILAGGLIGLTGGTTSVSSGIYEVGIGPDVPEGYVEAAESHDSIQVHYVDSPADAQHVDVVLYMSDRSLRAEHKPTEKGEAAVSTLNDAIDDYNQRQMQKNPDKNAAYPVEVVVSYVPQFDGVDSESSTDGGSSSGDGTGGDQSGSTSPATPNDVEDGDAGTTPNDMSPPFPFESLILAFVFLIPMNFIVQAYGSSMIDERLNRRGELLLVSPVSRYDIIAGKTLPYLGVIALVATAISVAIGGGLVSVAAILPLAFTYLASVFVASIFARSYKELTFLTLGISVLVTSFAFIPAIFTEVHPISVISPLTMVITTLRGDEVALGDFLFSTMPVFLTGVLLFALGTGIYREEDLFTQRRVREKFLDALAQQTHSRKSAFVLGAASIPFVFVAELLTVASLFVIPEIISLPLLLATAAFIEEFAKSIHIYAGYEKSRYDRSLKTAVITGALSGFGFFAAEKLTAVVQYVGLLNLDIGRLAFEGGLAPTASGGTVGLAIFAIWPFLHSITTVVSAVGAARGRRGYVVGLLLATLLHIAYNLTVVSSYGI